MRTSLAALAAVALVIVPSAATQPDAAPAPQSLRGFLLRPSEPITHAFPRTPAFAWAPVRAARCYQLEVATTRAFARKSLVWSNASRKTGSTTACGAGGPTISAPAASVDVALPWIAGQLYARVRAITSGGVSPWSGTFAFAVRPDATASPLSAQPGLLRWSPVSGATGYEVWLVDADRIFSTSTNVGDQRELYTFHPEASWTSSVKWRVRAVRRLDGVPSGLPSVSYGPWSETFTATNPAFDSGPLRLTTSLADSTQERSHELTPGFAFRGATGSNGQAATLFRVYVASDRACTNVVFRGTAVGSPAYAPRTAGLLTLPASTADVAAAATKVLQSSEGGEGARTLSADAQAFVTNEATNASAGAQARVDLADARYFWTVVPVGVVPSPDGNGVQYRDLELPQDACAAGRVQSFSKASAPVLTGTGGVPFVSGLTPAGRLLSSTGRVPAVYGSPVVAWLPAAGAAQYQVQWSPTKSPWRVAGSKRTHATSALLDLAPGRWFYRVRGLDPDRLGTAAMTWSPPAELRVAKPRFAVLGG